MKSPTPLSQGKETVDKILWKYRWSGNSLSIHSMVRKPTPFHRLLKLIFGRYFYPYEK